jgi:hypothetical protein
MISHEQMQLAMRTHALTLSVVTTGSVQLSATATGYARSAGSFLTDGFRVGMELTGTSFDTAQNNAAKAITAVSALAISAPGCAVEAVGARTLTVGLPALRAWENVPLEPIAGRPFVEEQYLPGPSRQITLGSLAQLEVTPMYVLLLYAVANAGLGTSVPYVDALLTLFAPGTPITLTNGDVLRVRTDVAPFRGQLRQDRPGWAVVPLTIPFRLRTANSL